jgi:hypothetical protein
MLEAEPCVYSIPEKRNGLGRHGRRFGNLYCARESPGSCPFEPRMKLPARRAARTWASGAKRPFLRHTGGRATRRDKIVPLDIALSQEVERGLLRIGVLECRAWCLCDLHGHGQEVHFGPLSKGITSAEGQLVQRAKDAAICGAADRNTGHLE